MYRCLSTEETICPVITETMYERLLTAENIIRRVSMPETRHRCLMVSVLRYGSLFITETRTVHLLLTVTICGSPVDIKSVCGRLLTQEGVRRRLRATENIYGLLSTI